MCDDREERLGGEHLRIVPSKAEFMLFRDLCAPQMCAAASSSLNIQTHFFFFLLFPFPHGVLTDQLLGEVNHLRSVFFFFVDLMALFALLYVHCFFSL